MLAMVLVISVALLPVSPRLQLATQPARQAVSELVQPTSDAVTSFLGGAGAAGPTGGGAPPHVEPVTTPPAQGTLLIPPSVAHGPSIEVTIAETVVSIETLVAAQGMDLRAPLEPAPGAVAAHAAVREVIEYLEADRELGPDIAAANDLVVSGRLVGAVEAALGPMD